MARAPHFTKENAREMQQRARASYLKRIEDEKTILAHHKASATDDSRNAKTREQLAVLDALIDSALAKKQLMHLSALCSAKERLWKLVSPTAGTLKPRRPGRGVPSFDEPISPVTPAAPQG